MHKKCLTIAYNIIKNFENTNFTEIFKICPKCLDVVIDKLEKHANEGKEENND